MTAKEDRTFATTAAAEIARVVRGAVAGALAVSQTPSLASVSLRIASATLELALLAEGALDETDRKACSDFFDVTMCADIARDLVGVTRTQVRARCTTAPPTDAEKQETIRLAGVHLDALRKSASAEQHPITALVVIDVMRRMAEAILEHVEPGRFTENMALVQAMQNAMRPAQIAVVENPELAVTSKGGSA